MSRATARGLALRPEELEFFAQDEPISIVPNISFGSVPVLNGGVLECASDHHGPFEPNTPMEVPLWLALALHKRRKCVIQVPEWLTVERLQDSCTEEWEDHNKFQPLPSHYMEIAKVLFEEARDSFGEDFLHTKELVERLEKVRMNKVADGLHELTGSLTVQMNHLSAMECNAIRPLFHGTLDRFVQIENLEATADAYDGR